MKQFVYKVKDRQGINSSGVVESMSEKSAVQVLQEKGFLVVGLKEKRQWNLTLVGPRVSKREIATFTGLLATMLSTGLPLSDALENLVQQTNNKFFKEVLQSIIHDVQSGMTLSEAMGRYPQVFDELYLNLVKAGEISGKVDEILGKVAETLESNLDFESKVKGALTYPAVVVTAMLGIAIFMITTIIPQIGGFYKQYGAELPLATRILVDIGNFAVGYFWVVGIVVGLMIYFVRVIMKNPAGAYLVNNFMLNMPVMGRLNQETTITIVCRTMGMLLYSGVAILDSLRIMAKAVPNNYFRTGLLAAAAMVEKGLPLSLAIKRDRNFPSIIGQLLAIGEETGTVDSSFTKIAKYYQEITERKTKTLTTLLEPIMILVMGLMIAGLAIAVLLPMFNLSNVIK